MDMFYLFAMSKIFMMPIGLTDSVPLPQRNSNETAPICREVCEYDNWYQRARCEKRMLDKIPLPPGCESAIILELQGNNITYVDTGSLSGYRNVRTLDISNNEISKLEPETFVNMANLKNVLFSNNQLLDIQNGTFSGTENHLQRLYLNGNQISKVNEHTFSGCYAIVTLYLNNNQLEFLPATLFCGLYNMQYINLTMNHLTHIAAHTFNGLINLRFLYLAYNKISWLPNGLFTGLQSLAEVELSHNALLYIPSPDSLGVHNTFQLFDVSHNNLTETGNILPYLTIAERFHFEGNPYICDCDFLLLQKWYYNKSDTERRNYARTGPVLCHMDSLVFNIDVVIAVTSCGAVSSTRFPRFTSMHEASLTEVLVLKSAVSTSGASLNNDSKMQSITQFADKIFGVTVYFAVILTLYLALWTAKSVQSIVLQKGYDFRKGMVP
ncbi:Carboxypeptidase N subunit 2 [Holothuria leucospilota]|uniref:Carboxypeptidase N subunit 2 n=1 Tax=Holothuria leucospilota TaxID=206669 RepID=A0A9Q1HFB0_HOLLE|nr:Carboxypeptidase N subunit 2 [Holothuria leucospilota]